MRNNTEKLGEIGGYWLSKRKEGESWCRTWFDPATRQTSRTSFGTDDFEEAKLALAAWVTTNGRMTQKEPAAAYLETFLMRYYQQHVKHRPSGEQARYALLNWSNFFPDALVSEITITRQREFVEDLRSKGLSDGYIRRILSVGQAALNWAFNEGEITTVPRISLSLVPEAEPRERLLTIEESKSLFAAVRQPHQEIYLMAAYATLARPAAILELTSKQIDCDNRLINLNPAGRAQNKKRRPVVPMCSTILPWMRGLPPGLVVQYRGQPLGRTKTMFDHLTATAARTIRREAAVTAHTHLRAGHRAKAWAALREGRRRAEAILEVTAYTIRHTMAAEMRKRGVPVWEVAGFLGHSSGYKTTERYAKYGPDYLAEGVRAIDDYFADIDRLRVASVWSVR